MVSKIKEFQEALYQYVLRDLDDLDFTYLLQALREGAGFYLGSLSKESHRPGGFGIFRTKKETVYGVFKDGLNS